MLFGAHRSAADDRHTLPGGLTVAVHSETSSTFSRPEVTPAPQMTKEEGMLDIALPAETLHNQVRAEILAGMHSMRKSACRIMRHSVFASVAASVQPS